MAEFKKLGYPLLIGASRKKFLDLFQNRVVNEREIETVVAHTSAILNGAKIIRTHHIENGRRMIDICQKLIENSDGNH